MAEVALLERLTRLPVLSLKKISLWHFSSNILCNNQELISLITKCNFNEHFYSKLTTRNGKAYKKVEAKANELFSKMPKIGEFKEMILEQLWPVTYRINRWIYVYAPTINVEFLNYFYWTNRGKIDSKRTAKYLIKNERIPIKERFLLACKLCLSKEIHEMWENMWIANRRNIRKEVPEKVRHILVFWISILEGRVDISERIISVVLLAVKIRSIEAIKYLFSIIPDIAKSGTAVLCFRRFILNLRFLPFLEEDESEIAYFLLLQMTETTLVDFFNSHLLVVLFLLIHSPGQKEFLNLLKDKLDTVSKNDIEQLLHAIFKKIYLSIFKDFDDSQLFYSIWQILDDDFKSYLRSSRILERCFCSLLSNYFKFILAEKPPKKAKKLIRWNQDKWGLLHFFIQKEIVTSVSLTKRQSLVLKYLRTRKSNTQAWIRLEEFLSNNRTKNND